MSGTPLGAGRPSEGPCVDSAPSTSSFGEFKPVCIHYTETVISALPELCDRFSHDPLRTLMSSKLVPEVRAVGVLGVPTPLLRRC